MSEHNHASIEVPSSERPVCRDGRSAGARRLRAKVDAYLAELGVPSLNALSASDAAIVRSLASASCSLDDLDSVRKRLEPVDGNAATRLINVHARAIKQFAELKRRLCKPAAPSLQQHLARHYPAPAVAEVVSAAPSQPAVQMPAGEPVGDAG